MADTLRQMVHEDVPEAAALWNDDYVHDRLSAARFERIVFGDRYYDAAGVLVAVAGNTLEGFVCCVAPDPKAVWMRPFAFLKGLCGRSYGPGGVADELLKAAEEFAATRAKEGLHAVEYAASGYFLPGIPLEYQDKVEFFLRNGFSQTRELHDVEVDLTSFVPTVWQREALKRAQEENIEILPYDPSMLDMMRELVAGINMPEWFPEGWEKQYKTKRHTFVAVKAGKMLGYANYHPGAERGDFGTTAVLPELRGRGIGTCLLTASMLRMKELATPKVWAHWANTPFYLKNGWHICRRYAVFNKALGR